MALAASSCVQTRRIRKGGLARCGSKPMKRAEPTTMSQRCARPVICSLMSSASASQPLASNFDESSEPGKTSRTSPRQGQALRRLDHEPAGSGCPQRVVITSCTHGRAPLETFSSRASSRRRTPHAASRQRRAIDARLPHHHPPAGLPQHLARLPARTTHK